MTTTTRQDIEPGLYPNMSFAEYTQIPAVNHSTLKYMGQSPAHCRAYMLRDRPDTPPLRLGRAAHAAVLEPDRFAQDYFVIPFLEDARADPDHKDHDPKYIGAAANKNSNAWKEHVFNHEHINRGKEMLTQTEWDYAHAICESVYAHATARNTMGPEGLDELVLVWIDDETKLACKARIDRLTPYYVVDIKATDDATSRPFSRAIERYDWHCQSAWYLWGLEMIDLMNGNPPRERDYAFVVVENKPPHAVMVYELNRQDRVIGFHTNRSRLSEFAKCKATDYWPAYIDNGIETIGLP